MNGWLATGRTSLTLWYLDSTLFYQNQCNRPCRQKTHPFYCLTKDLAHIYPRSEKDSALQRPWRALDRAMPPDATMVSLLALASPDCQLPCTECIQSTIQLFAPDCIKAHFFSPGCFVLSKRYPQSIVKTTTNLWVLNFVKGICRREI